MSSNSSLLAAAAGSVASLLTAPTAAASPAAPPIAPPPYPPVPAGENSVSHGSFLAGPSNEFYQGHTSQEMDLHSTLKRNGISGMPSRLPMIINRMPLRCRSRVLLDHHIPSLCRGMRPLALCMEQRPFTRCDKSFLMTIVCRNPPHCLRMSLHSCQLPLGLRRSMLTMSSWIGHGSNKLMRLGHCYPRKVWLCVRRRYIRCYGNMSH